MKSKDILAGFGVVALAALLEKLQCSNNPADQEQFSLINQKLDFIIQNQTDMATTLAQITAKADELQTALDAEQEQIAAAKTELTTKLDGQTALIAELRATIEANGSEEERSALLAKLDASIADVKSTVEDLPTGPTEPTEPTDPVEPTEPIEEEPTV